MTQGKQKQEGDGSCCLDRNPEEGRGKILLPSVYMSKHTQAGACKTGTAHPFQHNTGQQQETQGAQNRRYETVNSAADAAHNTDITLSAHHCTTMQLLKQQTSTENR